MAAEKQSLYPDGVGQPPAYPGQGASTVGPPLQGFAPPPDQAPPPAAYSGAPPVTYPVAAPERYPAAPHSHQPYVQPGIQPQPGAYVAGQPVMVQPGVTIAQPVVVVGQQFR